MSQNKFMESIHNRMPVILSDLKGQELWLKKGGKELLKPYQQKLDFIQLDDSLEHIYS